jgi:RND superfamily putative drug exporter
MAILPATMFLLGKLNWWLPPWLNRMLPNISTNVPDDLAARQQESARV